MKEIILLKMRLVINKQIFSKQIKTQQLKIRLKIRKIIARIHNFQKKKIKNLETRINNRIKLVVKRFLKNYFILKYFL
jgi:hypothetical protein